MLLGKLYFLAPYRIGWLMLLANVIGEAVEIRLRVDRRKQDLILWIISTAIFAGILGPWFGLIYGIVAGSIILAAVYVELVWLADVPATQYEKTRGRVPLPIPKFIVTLRGPVLSRSSTIYALGDWPQGLEQTFQLFILNPGTVRPQLPMSVRIESLNQGLRVRLGAGVEQCPEPGQIAKQEFSLVAESPLSNADVIVEVTHGDRTWRRTLRVRSVVMPTDLVVTRAKIERWKYGSNAAFNWRGDNDLYDPSTFQSADGLRKALGLAARYRMPTTVMLSPRLSLEQSEHQAFCEKFGWNRHSEEIPGFVQFFHDEVDLANEQEFPTKIDKPLSAEIGNHMYLHYGTHAAADPFNNWKSHAKMGEGNYPWLKKYPCSSFDEQRDNIIKCTESIERHLGVTTTCFTVPSDVYDHSTSRAVEAAGIEVGNDTDTNKIQKVLLFPKERHPEGCETLAELTRLIPKDVVNASQVAMLKFWIGFARRNRRALVYLAHHHLVMYQTNACYNLTSELLRYMLSDTEGDVYCATITSLGRYWRDVLSDRTKKVQIEFDGGCLTLINTAPRDLEGIPVELFFRSGKSLMIIVDVPSNSTVRIKL